MVAVKEEDRRSQDAMGLLAPPRGWMVPVNEKGSPAVGEMGAWESGSFYLYACGSGSRVSVSCLIELTEGHLCAPPRLPWRNVCIHGQDIQGH